MAGLRAADVAFLYGGGPHVVGDHALHIDAEVGDDLARAEAVRVAAMISPDAEIFYDWAGGLIWIAMPVADDGGAGAVGRAASLVGGHATLIRAPAAVRAKVDVFPKQDSGVAALTKRVKDSFDPKGILNPGRMWAGV